MISKKEHLNPTGFTTIFSFYASINRGLSPVLSYLYPNIVGVDRTKPNLPDSLNPY